MGCIIEIHNITYPTSLDDVSLICHRTGLPAKFGAKSMQFVSMPEIFKPIQPTLSTMKMTAISRLQPAARINNRNEAGSNSPVINTTNEKTQCGIKIGTLRNEKRRVLAIFRHAYWGLQLIWQLQRTSNLYEETSEKISEQTNRHTHTGKSPLWV